MGVWGVVDSHPGTTEHFHKTFDTPEIRERCRADLRERLRKDKSEVWSANALRSEASMVLWSCSAVPGWLLTAIVTGAGQSAVRHARTPTLQNSHHPQVPSFATKQEAIDFIKAHCTVGSNPERPLYQHMFTLLTSWDQARASGVGASTKSPQTISPSHCPHPHTPHQVTQHLIAKIAHYDALLPACPPQRALPNAATNVWLQPPPADDPGLDVAGVVAGLDRRLSLPLHRRLSAPSTVREKRVGETGVGSLYVIVQSVDHPMWMDGRQEMGGWIVICHPSARSTDRPTDRATHHPQPHSSTPCVTSSSTCAAASSSRSAAGRWPCSCPSPTTATPTRGRARWSSTRRTGAWRRTTRRSTRWDLRGWGLTQALICYVVL